MEIEQALRLFAYAVLPPDIFLIAIVLLLPFSFRAKVRTWIFSLGIVVAVMSIPATARLAVTPLLPEPDDVFGTGNIPSNVDAIVVLGGGIYSTLQGGFWLSETSAQRVAAAQTIAGISGLPLIVSGGNPNSDYPSEAETAAAQIPLPQGTVLETKSLNTYENAVNTAGILRERGWQRILLVTSDTHLLRAAALFRARGIEITGLYGVPEFKPFGLSDFVPSSSAFGMWRHALKEYVGILWYLTNGQISVGDLSTGG